jgi:hypothetical protein
MGYVPGFEWDIFVSYASDDNRDHAVEKFVEVVENEISDNLVNFFSPKEKIKIYFDRKRLAAKTAVNWEHELEAAATSAAVLVPLLSPNYLSSRNCDDERRWFAQQSHGCPFSVVGWLPVGRNETPPGLDLAQRHPPGNTFVGTMVPEDREQSAREFALKLRDALEEMRASISPVFLGPAAGRGLTTRKRLRDELERSGCRVTPEADFTFEDEAVVRTHLKGSLLGIHFPGDGLAFEGLRAMEESPRLACKTLLILPAGTMLSADERDVVAEIENQLASQGRITDIYTRLEAKTDDIVWEVVKAEVRRARFKREGKELKIGVACDFSDLDGAKVIVDVFGRMGLRAQYPLFDIEASTTKRIAAMRNTITQSQALLCYWAKADGDRLGGHLARDARRKFLARAWYLAPPLDLPAKQKLMQTGEMVLQQKTTEVDMESLMPFLEQLGWEPAS